MGYHEKLVDKLNRWCIFPDFSSGQLRLYISAGEDGSLELPVPDEIMAKIGRIFPANGRLEAHFEGEVAWYNAHASRWWE